MASRSYLVLDPARKLSLTAQIDNFTMAPTKDKIGIEEIRQLKKWAHLKPFMAGHKIALVISADKLTLEAQNAFLKLLEEPPKKTYLILAVPRAKTVLPTVASRCQLIRQPATLKELSFFKDRLILNSKQAEDDEADIISLKKLAQLSLAERSSTAQKMSEAKREMILHLTQQWAQEVQQEVFQRLFGSDQPSFAHLRRGILLYKKIMQVQRYLQSQVNIQRSLESLFFALKNSSHRV